MTKGRSKIQVLGFKLTKAERISALSIKKIRPKHCLEAAGYGFLSIFNLQLSVCIFAAGGSCG